MCLSLCISGIIDSQHGVLAQFLHRNVKACLVLQEEGAKEGDDYQFPDFGSIFGDIIESIVRPFILFIIYIISFTKILTAVWRRKRKRTRRRRKQ